jgi:cyclophilin family peptidyl-prolyl cis-trans isomerase
MRPAIAIFCLIVAGVVLAAMVSLRTPHPDPLPGEEPPTPPPTSTPAKTDPKAAAKDLGDVQSRFDKARVGAIRATLEIGNLVDGKDGKKDFVSKGTMELELYPQAAPKTVAHLTELSGKNFWDGIKVHRVDAEVAQMGDPNSRDADVQDFESKGIGNQGSGTTVPLEVADKLPNLQYTVGLARTSDPNSGDSQIYINLVDNPLFDFDYCVLGRVVKGTDIVGKIAKGDVIRHLQIYDAKR